MVKKKVSTRPEGDGTSSNDHNYSNGRKTVTSVAGRYMQISVMQIAVDRGGKVVKKKHKIQDDIKYKTHHADK